MQLSRIARAMAAAGLSWTLAAPALADAQSDRVDALERRLERSAQLIEQLTARLAALENGKAPVAAAPAAESDKAIVALQDSVNQITAGLNRRGADSGVPLHGFADVGAGWSSGADPVRLRGFNGGLLDLYLTPQLGDRVKGLIELAVEYGEDGTVGVDMERLQLGYTVSDAVTVWAGRFHTPMGLWNTSFHHGANLQTSIYRPRFIDFEDKGGIVPAHSVGLWASGKAGFGGGYLTYDAFIANGPHIAGRELNFGGFTDNDSNKLLGLNLGYKPGGRLEGLTVGIHAFGSKAQVLDSAGATFSRTDLRMTGGYVGYDENDWEVIGEYYHFDNAPQGGSRLSSNAWFAQVGRSFGTITPFVRAEKASLNPTDDFFRSQASGRSYERTAAGLRYALDARSSLKLELSSTRESAVNLLDADGATLPFAARSYRRGSFQYSVAF
jgi:hypothetical protein